MWRSARCHVRRAARAVGREAGALGRLTTTGIAIAPEDRKFLRRFLRPAGRIRDEARVPISDAALDLGPQTEARAWHLAERGLVKVDGKTARLTLAGVLAAASPSESIEVEFLARLLEESNE